ncbi:MAG: DUF4936 family protein [Gammaproteobacteria bacterium]
MQNNLLLYVYYKIAASERNSGLLGVKNIEKIIKTRYPNYITNHLRRLHLDSEHKETWMETYTGVSEEQLEKFKVELSDLAEINGLPKERKYEVFITL